MPQNSLVGTTIKLPPQPVVPNLIGQQIASPIPKPQSLVGTNISQTTLSQRAPAMTPKTSPEQTKRIVNDTFQNLKKIDLTAGIGSVGSTVAKAAVGDTLKVMSMSNLLKAKNLLTQGSERAGSVMYHMNQLANGKSLPINVRTLENGALHIEDGRHRLEAAKQLGLKDLLVRDVTNLYKPQRRTTLGRFDFK